MISVFQERGGQVDLTTKSHISQYDKAFNFEENDTIICYQGRR